MRRWDTDASVESDSRYSALVRFAFRHGAPEWLLNLLARWR